jgi:hypothetical protein
MPRDYLRNNFDGEIPFVDPADTVSQTNVASPPEKPVAPEEAPEDAYKSAVRAVYGAEPERPKREKAPDVRVNIPLRGARIGLPKFLGGKGFKPLGWAKFLPERAKFNISGEGLDRAAVAARDYLKTRPPGTESGFGAGFAGGLASSRAAASERRDADLEERKKQYGKDMENRMSYELELRKKALEPSDEEEAGIFGKDFINTEGEENLANFLNTYADAPEEVKMTARVYGRVPTAWVKPTPMMSPDALGFAAELAGAGVPITQLGLGRNPRMVGRVYAELRRKGLSGAGIARRQAEFRASASSLVQLMRMHTMASAFIQTADRNAKVALRLLDKIPGNSRFRVINGLVRDVSAQLGDAETTTFNLALDIVGKEFGRILSSPTMSGVLSEAEKANMRALISKDFTKEQFQRAIELLLLDSANRMQTYEEMIQQVMTGQLTLPNNLPGDETFIGDPRTGPTMDEVGKPSSGLEGLDTPNAGKTPTKPKTPATGGTP